MAGNAHRNRHRRRGAKPCSSTCLYCKHRPKVGKELGLFRNKNGNRHNPASKKRQKRPNKK
jgi:hypothetical protein